MLAQRLARDTPPTAKPDQLWQYVEAAWTAVPQRYIQSLFDSKPRSSLSELSQQQLQNKYKNMEEESQNQRSLDKVETFKTGGGTKRLLTTSLDEQLAAMGALIEPQLCI
ncbi:hypothetical protein TNCV_1454301 [Trichonephila clavipes]|nr:hypothetical protein TNCV_1454301 [Trichonephila clavipes]